MRRIVGLVVAAALLAAVFSTAAGAANTATSTASAALVAPLGVTNTQPLLFGSLALTGTAGTVVMSPAGAASVSPVGSVLLVSPSTRQEATFAVIGAPSSLYNITFSSGNTLVGPAGSSAMALDTFKAVSTNHGAGTVGNTDVAGNDGIAVGATLHCPTSNLDGAYNGSFTLTVAY